MNHSLHNHTRIKGQLAGLQFLAIMNKAALNIHLQVFFFFFFFVNENLCFLEQMSKSVIARSYGSNHMFGYFF